MVSYCVFSPCFWRSIIGNFCYANYTIFNPTIDAIKVVMKNILARDACSCKNMIPNSTVPTAPMPVHTGYAVPIGMVCTATDSSHMLAVRLTMNPAVHKRNAMPFEPFIFPMQKAKAVSNMPAVIKIIQSIGESFNVIRF